MHEELKELEPSGTFLCIGRPAESLRQSANESNPLTKQAERSVNEVIVMHEETERQVALLVLN